MPDFNNPVNGDSFDVELVISSLGTKLTKYDKLAIAVLPTHEFKGDVLLVTPEEIEYDILPGWKLHPVWILGSLSRLCHAVYYSKCPTLIED